MKILSMKLGNFRQFFGEQEIEFATGVGGQNVTVLHGYNGSGKTALLNAFVWCLYGETTPDLESPDRLVNEKALAEAEIGEELYVYVSLMFEVDQDRYLIERRIAGSKDGDNSMLKGEPQIEMTVTGTDGETKSVADRPDLRQKRINQMLPKDLYPFFFFNGERVERLASPDAYDRVEAGIKTLLDIELFERTAYHLRGHVVKELSSQLKSVADSDLAAAIAEEETLDSEESVQKEHLEEHRKNRSTIDVQIEDVEEKQASIEELKGLAEDRDRQRKEEQRCSEELQSVERELAAAISKNGFLAFSEPVLSAAEEQIGSARKRGDLPAKIKPQFVDDLIANDECICGRPLGANTSELKKLQDWKSATGLAELEEAISHTHASLGVMTERRSSLLSEIDRTQARRATLIEQRRTARQAIAAIEEDMGGRELGEEPAALSALLIRLRNQRTEIGAKILHCEGELQRLDDEREDVRRRIEKLKVQDERAALLKGQRESVERIADVLSEIVEIQKDDVRQSLDEQISSIWSDAAIKDYEASVGADYRLMLTKKVGGQSIPVHGASTGEKQVLALSFIASLVRKAREHFDDSAGDAVAGRLGGLYPLVMDSPFGALEDDYRQKVAEWVPSLAHQVVIMVSKTQWRNEVDDAVRERIGKRYVLELHSSKSGSDRTIGLDGVEHPYVVEQVDPSEYTVLRPVEASA